MTPLFADAFYYFALLNPHDEAHERAVQFTSDFDGSMVTTTWVLTELADGMAEPGNREPFHQFYQGLLKDPKVKIVPAEQALFEEGEALFASRPDKAWSLTDCVSFLVMKQEGITEALTGDHHFEQAGYIALLKA